MEQQMTLFDRELPQPLAARLRPQSLEEYAGQTHLLGKGKVLRRLIENDQVSSMIFWGPPGVGKTICGHQGHQLFHCPLRQCGRQQRFRHTAFS